MQVTELVSEGLTRELKVVLPAVDLGAKLEKRLNEIQSQVRINGFRPGKVPLAHLRRVYGKSIMIEVVEAAVNEATGKALDERGEKPAMEPQIKLPEDQNAIEAVIEGREDLAYTLRFDVLPAVKLGDFSTIEVIKEVAEPTDEEVDDALQTLAKQNRPVAPRPEGEAAEQGDRLTINYAGRIDGEPFQGGAADGAFLEIGSGRFIPGFEEQLVGAKAGEERELTVSFPDDYIVERLRGKQAVFDVKVTEVAAPGEIKLDDDLAKSLGLESLAKLREAVRAQIAGEYQGAVRRKLKRRLLDSLDSMHQFDLPPSLVDQEFEAIWLEATSDLERRGRTFEDENTTEEKAREEYRSIAARRVRLGLVLAEAGRKNNIDVTDAEAQNALMERVRQFPGQEQAVWDYYRKTPAALAQLRAPVFEEKVVDFILELAKVKEVSVARTVLFKDPEDGEDASSADKGV